MNKRSKHPRLGEGVDVYEKNDNFPVTLKIVLLYKKGANAKNCFIVCVTCFDCICFRL
jgi:hypothetical protein